MAKKIFRSTMAVGLWVLLLSAALFLGMLYQYFTDRFTQELESETWLVARGVESMGQDYLDGLRTDNRITWVAPDGTVLYDNEADAASMENHADREEIQEALFGIQGTARRESATLSQLTIYVAHRLDDGSVIRLAGSQSTVVHLLMAMAPPIVLILIVTLIFAAALSSRLTKRLVRPILELDLERPEDSEVYDELSPLLTRIRRQNDTIRAQMDQLRQQKQEFTALTENMSEGFLLLDAKGRVLSYNTGVLRLLGAAAPAEEASVLTLDRGDVFQQLVEQVLDGRRSQVRMERAGRVLQLLGDPVLRDGETAGAVLVLLDVTEREQAEQMRREFTANVSHELKTPLTSISGMAEIMKDGLVKQEDVRGFAADIYQESQRLIRLVEDILHLSRLDEGGGGLERQEIDLLDLARTVEDRLQSTAKQHQVELELTGTTGHPGPALGGGGDGVQPVRQRHQVQPPRRQGVRPGGGRGGRGHRDRVRHGHRHPPGGPGAGVRAVLPGGQEPLQGHRRHRPGPVHRQARGRPPQRPGGAGQRPRKGHHGAPALPQGAERIRLFRAAPRGRPPYSKICTNFRKQIAKLLWKWYNHRTGESLSERAPKGHQRKRRFDYGIHAAAAPVQPQDGGHGDQRSLRHPPLPQHPLYRHHPHEARAHHGPGGGHRPVPAVHL